MDKQKVAERWSDSAVAFDAFSPEVYWLAIPAVQARHQRRACGGHNYPSWVEYCVREFMPTLPAERMLSIGCGHGALERQLHALGAFGACDAYDIAPAAIEGARAAATYSGIQSIAYEICDVEHFDFGQDRYDAIWFNGSLHHIAALEPVLNRVRLALKPGGMLFFNEYVGANHFAFPPAQRDAIAQAFHLIPPAYRKSFAPHDYGEVAMHAPLPDPIEVERVDPSEAVRSSDILSVVSSTFDIIALNKAGGTLLQFLLSGIAGNFRADDPHSMRLLNMLFEIEDSLIDTGALPSDFVVCVARPKPGRAFIPGETRSASALQTELSQIRQSLADLAADASDARGQIDHLRQRLGRPC